MAKPKLRFSKYDVLETEHALYRGNCIEILEKLPEKSVNLVFADPPYHLQLKQDLYRPNQTKVDGVNENWDKFGSNEAYDHFTKAWLSACRRIMTDNATIWVIGSYHNIFRVGKILMDLGFWILNDIQWYKTNPMPNFRGVRFTNATETLIWAKKSEKQKSYTFNHQVMKQLNDGKQMTSVWKLPLCTGKERIKNKMGKKAHPTQKPEELLRRVILSSSHEGDTILDPFSGSGTTNAVAKQLKRKSIGIERELSYIKIAKKRLVGINPADFEALRLTEPNKKSLPRVSMETLVKVGLIKKNQTLYTKNKEQSATVLANGHIKNGVGTGSIHKIGALIKNTEACNGWTFWYSELPDKKNELTLIDTFREIYRKRYEL